MSDRANKVVKNFVITVLAIIACVLAYESFTANGKAWPYFDRRPISWGVTFLFWGATICGALAWLASCFQVSEEEMRAEQQAAEIIE